VMSSSPESRKDDRMPCKKHPTGHKSSKNHENKSETSQERNSDVEQQLTRTNTSHVSKSNEGRSDPEPSCQRSRNVSTEEDLLSSDSDVQVTRHQLNVHNISSESDASSLDLQMTASSQTTINWAVTGEEGGNEIVMEGVPQTDCGINGETYVCNDVSDTCSNQNINQTGNDPVSDSNNCEDACESVKHSDCDNNKSPNVSLKSD